MSEYDGSIEVRPDDKGGIDEIVGDGVLVHIERMDKGAWFIILTRPDQTQEAFWLTGKGKVEFTLTESRPAPDTGPNAEPWMLTSSFAAGRLAGIRDAVKVVQLNAISAQPGRGLLAIGSETQVLIDDILALAERGEG